MQFLSVSVALGSPSRGFTSGFLFRYSSIAHLITSFIRHESLEPEPNRTPRMDPSRADAHLGTKAKAKPVGETRAHVDEDTGHECAAG